MNILESLKELLEVDLDEQIFDNQLILYINLGIGFLANNNIPVTSITDSSVANDWTGLSDDDTNVVISYLQLHVLQRFDRTLMTKNANTTQMWIEKEKDSLLYHLKCKFDVGEGS
jgi:hypothetical protein